MIITTENHVIEIKARYSWAERNSKDALASVLATAKLAYFDAYMVATQRNCKHIAEEFLNIYNALEEKYEELCPSVP